LKALILDRKEKMLGEVNNSTHTIAGNKHTRWKRHLEKFKAYCKSNSKLTNNNKSVKKKFQVAIVGWKGTIKGSQRLDKTVDCGVPR
jgi:hypothetical protein